MRNFVRLVFKFTLILFIFVGIVIGAVIVYAKMYGKDFDIKNGIFTDNREPVTVLVAGLHPDGPLTDFIMVVKYNPKSGKVNALSIPRDTKVVGTIDGKINSAYAKGKDIEKLKDKVKEVTSLKVDYYVILDTATVRKMVDAIGGIPMDVPINMYYDDEEQGLLPHVIMRHPIDEGLIARFPVALVLTHIVMRILTPQQVDVRRTIPVLRRQGHPWS